MWRKSDVELGIYEEELWSEPPAHYVRRALGRELFERRGLSRGGRSGPMFLDVEVRAFEEVIEPKHEVRIEIWVALSDAEERGLFERSFSVVNPVAEEHGKSMARAMGEALDEAVRAVGTRVQAALVALPKPEEGG